jgi:lysozyme
VTVSLLIAELTADEGLRLTAYDDATGSPIKSGTTVKGHVTVGVGRALDVRGISTDEAKYLLANDIAAFTLGLTQKYIWFNNLDGVRQRVLVNLAFNLGMSGLAEFKQMLAAVADHDFDTAAREMENSEWYRQTGARAARLSAAMSSGVMQ